MRCFVVGCLGDGGGGCKASIDGVDVVSVDKERKEVKADTIRWRGVYMAGDNMLKDIQGGQRWTTWNAVTAGYVPIRIRELPAFHIE